MRSKYCSFWISNANWTQSDSNSSIANKRHKFNQVCVRPSSPNQTLPFANRGVGEGLTVVVMADGGGWWG